MPNYFGLTVRATPNSLVAGERFICVADRADGTVWLIPVNGRSSSDTTKYVPKDLWKIEVEGECESAFRSVIDKLQEFINIRANDGDFDSKNVRSAKDNLAAASKAYDDLYAPVASPAYPPSDELVATPMNGEFVMLDLTFTSSKVGKLIVCELADGGAGEYIVIYESEGFYYVVPTLNVVEGFQITRFHKEDVTIIDEYDDHGFVDAFVDRLEEFGDRNDQDDEEPYAFVTIDSARTTARQIARCLERRLMQQGGVIGAFQRFADVLCGGR